MKALKILALSLVCGLAMWANATPAKSEAVKMSFKLKINGRDSTPLVVTNFGQEATISQSDLPDGKNGYELSATPTRVEAKDGKEFLKISMKISEIVKGKKQLVAQPEMLVEDGVTATLKQTSKDGKKLEVTVTPTTHFEMSR